MIFSHIQILFLLFSSSYNLNSDLPQWISDDEQLDLPDFYLIQFPDLGKILFRRYLMCHFYYSYSDPQYSYFWNYHQMRWEVGEHMKIQENCDLVKDNYNGAIYYREDNDVSKEGPVLKFNDSIFLDIQTLNINESKPYFTIQGSEIQQRHVMDWNINDCGRYALRNSNSESCFIIISFKDNAYSQYDQCKFRPLELDESGLLREVIQPEQVQIIKKENCKENKNPFAYSENQNSQEIEGKMILWSLVLCAILILTLVFLCLCFCMKNNIYCFQETPHNQETELV